MATFTCIFPTVYKGLRRPKGCTITLPDAEIRLPGNEPLLNPRSFQRDDPAGPVPAAAPAAATAERDSLMLRLSTMGITVPAKATIAQMQKLLGDATDPNGHPSQ